MVKEYASLNEAVYECFKSYIGTEEETLLHEERFVTKAFKKFVGDKEFKKYDSYEDKQWKNAWREFDMKAFKEN